MKVQECIFVWFDNFPKNYRDLKGVARVLLFLVLHKNNDF